MTGCAFLGLEADVALVTGAGRGLGAACAEVLARSGCRVALLDLDQRAIEERSGAIVAEGGTAIAVPVDVTDPIAVRDAVRSVSSQLGEPTVLVNNAGVFDLRDTADIDAASFHRMIDVHALGALYFIQATAPAMKAGGHGRIVNISSIGAEIGLVGHAHYGAAKAAVAALTRSMARELGPHGITCNAVSPGNIDTDNEVLRFRRQQEPSYYENFSASLPIARLGHPLDVAHAVTFLASRAAGYITGQSLRVDGGCVMA